MRETWSAKSNGTSAQASMPIIHETDVLVIGAGIAGLTAAIEASDRGAKVIMLDKGPFTRSGSSGMNWGYWFLSELENSPWPKDPDGVFQWLIKLNEGIGDQRILRSLADGMFTEKRALWTENTGSICQRSDQDKIDFQPSTSAVYWAFYPWAAGQEVLKRKIPVFERTMATRLLTRDGQGCGATAVDIRTGEFMVFKAKSVIIATGSIGWLYGWFGVGPLSAVQPECTGDGHALLHYAGAELMNMEFGKGEMRNVTPATVAGSFGGIGAAPSSPDIIDGLCNKDGEFFLKGKDFASLVLDYGKFVEAFNEQITNGNGGPNGGVYYDAKAGWEMNPYQIVIKRLQERLGWDPCEAPVEVLPGLYDWGAASLVQANINGRNETTVPGIYAIAMGAVAWEGSAWGLRAGKAAAEWAAKPGRAEVDDKQYIDERQRVYGLFEKSPKDPLRPHVIRQRVQKLATKYLGLSRSGEGLEACVAELQRIRREDYPRMWLASKTHTWNREFYEALETEYMIDVQEMVARSALMRTESRFAHFRVDYPKKDNANWLANTYVTRVDGQMVLEKRPAVCTEIGIKDVRRMLQ